MLSPTATVVREGARLDIDADQLVPGDIVVIKSGDKVPADLRLLQATNLQVQRQQQQGGQTGCQRSCHDRRLLVAVVGACSGQSYSCAEGLAAGTGGGYTGLYSPVTANLSVLTSA